GLPLSLRPSGCGDVSPAHGQRPALPAPRRNRWCAALTATCTCPSIWPCSKMTNGFAARLISNRLVTISEPQQPDPARRAPTARLAPVPPLPSDRRLAIGFPDLQQSGRPPAGTDPCATVPARQLGLPDRQPAHRGTAPAPALPAVLQPGLVRCAAARRVVLC